MSLSVCLLTRNEEHNLPRALGSVVGVADELIVADTGSVDRTASVAAALGAKVCSFAWNDDFAAGRDFALDQATGDWILWLNPDEELLPDSRSALSECLTHADAFGYYLRVQDMAKADRLDQFTETAQLRLHRRRPEIRSFGRLHPVFKPPLEKIARQEGKHVLMANVALRRHAYLSPVTEPKLRWALRLLELELRDRPGQLHYLIEYGRTLLLLNDPKGHIVLAEAVDQILPACGAASAPSPQVQRLLEYLMTVPPSHSRSRLSREQARELAERWFPTSPPLLWQAAQSYFQAGDFRRSAELLERLVELGTTGDYDRSENFEPGILGDSALMNLGACYARLRELEKAEACFRQLLNSQKVGSKAAQILTSLQAQRARLT
jgi:tetratricopeptide (TPR) repeat protein